MRGAPDAACGLHVRVLARTSAALATIVVFRVGVGVAALGVAVLGVVVVRVVVMGLVV